MNNIDEEDKIFDKLAKSYIFIIKLLSFLLILSIKVMHRKLLINI